MTMLTVVDHEAKSPEFSHLNLGVDEYQFTTKLHLALQSSGHLLTRDQVKACLLIVNAGFSPPPIQPQQV